MSENPTYYLKNKNAPKSNFLLASVEDKRKYFCNYSYDYEWINTNESVITTARVNTYDFLELTTQQLKFRKNNVEHTFRIRKIQEITVTAKKYILPLLIGGVITPFAIVAYFKGIFVPAIGIAVVFTGLMLFYYGFKGAYQLRIKTTNGEEMFFIEELTAPFEAFLSAVRKEIKAPNFI